MDIMDTAVILSPVELSAGNTNAARCRQSIEEAMGLPTMIAAPDVTIEINKTPF